MAGKCPWCGRGPYRLLAGHTNKSHGIDKYELRDLAGVAYSTSICDPELAEELSKNSKRRGSGGVIASAGPRKQARISDAGRAAWREAVGRLTFAQHSAAGKIGGPKGGAIRGAQMRKPRQPCVVCGGEIPFISGNKVWKTCSPECRRTNKSRAVAASRAQRRSEYCKSGHPLTGDNLKIVPHGAGQKRVCVECQRLYQRAYRLRKSAGGAS